MFQCCRCPSTEADGELVVSPMQESAVYPKSTVKLQEQQHQSTAERPKGNMENVQNAAPELSIPVRREAPVTVQSSASCCSLHGFQALLLGSKAKREAATSRKKPTLLEASCKQARAPEPVKPGALPVQDAEKEPKPIHEPQLTTEIATAPISEQDSHSRKAEDVLASTGAHPDLSGRWMASRVEGDMEQKLKDDGLPWVVRKIVKGTNYGAGQAFQVISQSGDSVKITDEIPTQQPRTMEFVVGGDWAEIAGFACAADAPPEAKTKAGKAGKPVMLKAFWDADALVIKSKTLDGETLPDSRRWLDPQTGELVLGTATSTGAQARQFWAKQ